MTYPELEQISRVLDNLYLSGIKPFKYPHNLKGIKYVISCVDPKYVAPSHYGMDVIDGDVTFFYLPYNDNVYQNLWDPNTHSPTIRKYRSNVYDSRAQQYLENLYANKPMIEISYHILDHVLNSGQNVLVHCMAGVSRSASMIIYYLMRKYGMSFEDAHKLVKSKRTIVNPNKSFQAQLKLYDTLRESMTQQHGNAMIDRILQQ